jgi:uncharacterized protein YeaO (DUF488 family)
MPIKTKRWDEPKNPDDGFRLLVCRYRPRALPKSKETWDLWWSQLGPSKELHAAIYGKNGPPMPWDEFRRCYIEEMNAQEDSIAVLAEKAAEGATLTLMCSSACIDPARCHRTLLRQLIEERMARANHEIANRLSDD